MLEKPLVNRAQMPGGSAHPVGERRAVEIAPLTLVDLRLPVKRQVIGIFGDHCYLMQTTYSIIIDTDPVSIVSHLNERPCHLQRKLLYFKLDFE